MSHAISADNLLSTLISRPMAMYPEFGLNMIRQVDAIRSKGLELSINSPQGLPNVEPIHAIDPSGVALLEIKGALVKSASPTEEWLFRLISYDRISDALEEIQQSEARALVINIDSPGGMVVGCSEICDTILEIGKSIPVIAHTSSEACSAAFRIAQACTHFYPSASSYVGSVGVYIAIYNYTKQLEAMGISLELYRSGKYKAQGLIGKASTEEERGFMQAEVEELHENFKQAVLSRRPSVSKDWMEGQSFNGAKALELGFCDGISPSIHKLCRDVAEAVKK